MNEKKIKQSLLNLNNALTRLEETVNDHSDNIYRQDALIKRLEFSIELFWMNLLERLARKSKTALTARVKKGTCEPENC